jgi:hypothetical protein
VPSRRGSPSVADSGRVAWATSLLAEHPDAQAPLAAGATANLATAIVAPNHATADGSSRRPSSARRFEIKPVARLIFSQAIGPATVEDVARPAGTRPLLHTRRAAMRPEVA